MALQLNQGAAIRCNDFVLTDCTGTYNAATNPGGYGDPNPEFVDASQYRVRVFPPEKDTPVFEGNFLVASGPDASGYYSLTVPSSLVPTDKEGDIIDGIWTVEFNRDGEINTYKVLQRAIADRKIRKQVCCGAGNLSKVSLRLDLLAVCELHRCGDYGQAQSLLNKVHKDLNEDCGCGC